MKGFLLFFLTVCAVFGPIFVIGRLMFNYRIQKLINLGIIPPKGSALNDAVIRALIQRGEMGIAAKLYRSREKVSLTEAVSAIRKLKDVIALGGQS
jgi:hypothetical protein